MRRTALFNPYVGVEKSRLLGSASTCYVFFHDDGTPVVTASGNFMFCFNENRVAEMLAKASEKRYRPADISKLSPADAAKVQRLRELFPPPTGATTPPPEPEPQTAPPPPPPPRQSAPPPRRAAASSAPAIPEIDIGYYHVDIPGESVMPLKDVIANIMRDPRADVHMVWLEGMPDWEDALMVPMIANLLSTFARSTASAPPPPSSPPPRARKPEPEPEFSPRAKRKAGPSKEERVAAARAAYLEKKPRFGLQLSKTVMGQAYGPQREYSAQGAFEAPLLENINRIESTRPSYHPVDLMRLLDRNNADAFPVVEALFAEFMRTPGAPSQFNFKTARRLASELDHLRSLSKDEQMSAEVQEKFRMIHYEMSDILSQYVNTVLGDILARMMPQVELRTNPRFYR